MKIYLKPLAYFLFYYFIISISCNAASKTKLKPKAVKNTRTNANTVSIAEPPIDTTYKSIHVIVALCDNTFQGIVPVPAKIGNGQDAANNLYWSCAFGVKTYFKNSTDWQLISSNAIDSVILERIVFKHRFLKYFIIADAYRWQ